MRQIDRYSAKGHLSADLVAAQTRCAEVHIERRCQHLSSEHRVAGPTGTARGSIDDSGDIARLSCTSCGGIVFVRVVERQERMQRSRAVVAVVLDDILALAILPEAHRQRARAGIADRYGLA